MCCLTETELTEDEIKDMYAQPMKKKDKKGKKGTLFIIKI